MRRVSRLVMLAVRKTLMDHILAWSGGWLACGRTLVLVRKRFREWTTCGRPFELLEVLSHRVEPGVGLVVIVQLVQGSLVRRTAATVDVLHAMVWRYQDSLI